MRILLLNQYYPPDTSATAAVVCDVAEICARRHEVVVIAGRPSYAPVERHPYYLRRRETRVGVSVERLGSTAYDRSNMAGRVTNYLSFAALAVIRAAAVDADVILCFSDPPIIAIGCALVAKLRQKPFVYAIQDLHPDMIIASREKPPAAWLRVWERVHRWAAKQASLVVVLGEDMRERLMAKGLESARVAIVRSGAVVPAHPVSREHPVCQRLRSGFPFVALHAGNMSFYGAWKTLVEAAALVQGSGVGLVFVGDGAAKQHIESMAAGQPSVRFFPFRPPEELQYVLAAPDVHIVTIRRGLEGTVVPSKVYAILAAGRPVLVVASEQSDVARLVLKHGCGLVADPDTPFSVADALCNLASDPARVASMAERARVIAPSFAREKQLEHLVALVEATPLTARA